MQSLFALIRLFCGTMKLYFPHDKPTSLCILPLSVPSRRTVASGIKVSLLERDTPRRLTRRSPWAVKRLSRRVQVAPEHGARLAREAELLRRLRHPCVVGYRGVTAGAAPGSVTLMMEAASASLLDLVEARVEAESDPRPFPLADIATVGGWSGSLGGVE